MEHGSTAVWCQWDVLDSYPEWNTVQLQCGVSGMCWTRTQNGTRFNCSVVSVGCAGLVPRMEHGSTAVWCQWDVLDSYPEWNTVQLQCGVSGMCWTRTQNGTRFNCSVVSVGCAGLVPRMEHGSTAVWCQWDVLDSYPEWNMVQLQCGVSGMCWTCTQNGTWFNCSVVSVGCAGLVPGMEHGSKSGSDPD
ncbi:hypothetical protein ACJMK2_013970 [Sinanodonta woodiana]|uniref:SRCR domain-containing protein n=1 Tax=Sinanodonta woodiana TaxID=1069815 RepID=A0ABD3UZN1_SINWO